MLSSTSLFPHLVCGKLSRILCPQQILEKQPAPMDQCLLGPPSGQLASQPQSASYPLSDLRLCPLGLPSSKNLEEPCRALWFFECRMRQRVGDLEFFDSCPHNPSSNLHVFPFIPSMWVKTYTKLALVISNLILKYGSSLNILRRPHPKLRIKYFGFSTQL